MGKRVRPYTTISAEERLGRAVALLPESAQRALTTVAARGDLPLVAGTWSDGAAGCLVANVVAAIAADAEPGAQHTLDVRVLELLPELSSRDLNRLVVAWDEAALADGAVGDAELRRLLRGALAWAGVEPALATRS